MVPVFEDVFSEAQAAMVSQAMEYVSGKVTDVYIHFFIDHGSTGGNVFYVKDGKTLFVNEIGDPARPVSQQFDLLIAIARQAERIHYAGQEFDCAVPVMGHLHFRVTQGSLDASYSYETVDLDDDPPWFEDFRQWKQSVQKELDSVD